MAGWRKPPKHLYRIVVQAGDGQPRRYGEIMGGTYTLRKEALACWARNKQRGRQVRVYKAEPTWVEVTDMWDEEAAEQ